MEVDTRSESKCKANPDPVVPSAMNDITSATQCDANPHLIVPSSGRANDNSGSGSNTDVDKPVGRDAGREGAEAPVVVETASGFVRFSETETTKGGESGDSGQQRREKRVKCVRFSSEPGTEKEMISAKGVWKSLCCGLLNAFENLASLPLGFRLWLWFVQMLALSWCSQVLTPDANNTSGPDGFFAVVYQSIYSFFLTVTLFAVSMLRIAIYSVQILLTLVIGNEIGAVCQAINRVADKITRFHH